VKPTFEEMIACAAGIGPDGHPEPEPPTDTLPPIVDGVEFLTTDIALPRELVYGVLHQGSKMVLGGGSKTYKTWLLLDLAVSVATGVPWLSFKTALGRVLILNLEIQAAFFQQRLLAIAKAKGVTLAKGQIDVWNLRGHAASFKEIIPKIIRRVMESKYDLIIIDPIYKLYGEMDENSAGAVAMLQNSLERLAVETGAAVVFGAHYSKGNQAGKEAIDRISGSGVFARDPDSILNFTRHEEQDAFTVEATLRNLPPIKPFCARWQYPLMQRDDSLDPIKLKGAKGKTKTKPTNEEFLRLFKSDPNNPRAALMSAVQLKEKFHSNRWDESTAPALRDECEGSGKLAIHHGAHNQKLAGLPDMVDAYSKQQSEKGSILEQAPLVAKAKRKKRKK